MTRATKVLFYGSIGALLVVAAATVYQISRLAKGVQPEESGLFLVIDVMMMASILRIIRDIWVSAGS